MRRMKSSAGYSRIANKRQIIQAEPFEDEHLKHPICVIEPNSIGYGFGQMSIVDMLGPIQDVLSWFVNSHMFNVRSALNNMFISRPQLHRDAGLKRSRSWKVYPP